MSYGITPQGFVRKSFDEIITDMRLRAQNTFGDDIDLNLSSPVGMMIYLMTYDLSQQWELAEDIYYSLWLDSSEGVNLERVARLGFVTRRVPTYAIVELEFTGDAGVTVPENTLAETRSGIVFETLTDLVIPADGTGTVNARATVSGGAGMVLTHTINSIKTPIAGITAVTNPNPAAGGRNLETDVELRSRYQDATATIGSSLPAIQSALENLSGVRGAWVYENITNGADGNGLPPRSVEAVIAGGVDQKIADVIFRQKPAGISTYGNNNLTIYDSKGIPHPVAFSRPEDISIYVKYTISVGSAWQGAESINRMKLDAVKYIGGVAFEKDYTGLNVGEDVYPWKLGACVNEIPGIENLSVALGTSPDPAAGNIIPISIRQIARTDDTKIVVVIQ